MAVVEQVDCVIAARWVVPVEPAQAALADHSVVVHAGRILDLLPAEEANQRYLAERSFDLPRHVLMPGLVDLHTRAAPLLLRGAESAERRWISRQFVHDGTLLACAEMIRGGVTCFNDMYFYPEAAASAATACGIRAAIGLPVRSSPSPYAADVDDYIDKGLAARDVASDKPLLSFCMATDAPNELSDAALGRMLTMADELDLPIHLPLHETRGAIDASLSRWSMRPLERLRRLGLVGSRLIAAHASHCLESEIEQLARFGCSVAYCPSANLRHADGFAPLGKIVAAGINFGIGTGSAARERLDIIEELRLASLLAGAVDNGANALAAQRALHAATLGGAEALGLSTETGSIVPGKAADLCAVALDDCPTGCDPVAQLLQFGHREDVSHVWVAGQTLLEERRLCTLEVADLDKLRLLWRNNLEPIS